MPDEPLRLPPISTAPGLLTIVMVHETYSPLLRGYDPDLAFRCMRLMRQCIENRCRHPERFGLPRARPGLANVMGIIKNRAFGDFANAPNFNPLFIRDTNTIIRLAGTPGDSRYRRCYDHVLKAITAATEPTPPADVIKRNYFYWRTAGHGAPSLPTGVTAIEFETLLFNTFWGQSDLPN